MRAGYTMTALAALFLAFDTMMKLLELAPAVEGTVALGYPASAVFVIGVIELAALVGGLYLRDARLRELMPLRRGVA